MIGPGEVMSVLIAVIVPALLVAYIAGRFFRLREKKLEIEAMMAAEKAAQYASRSSELEARVRVLEKIATDQGIETAAQIEALRDRPALIPGDKIQ